MISVIVPTLNEEACLPRLLADLRRQNAARDVIVVDGGSRDRTLAKAREYDARILHAAPGRGAQLRRGAEAATGDIFLFLHADSRFPQDGLARIEERLSASPRLVGGNFGSCSMGIPGSAVGSPDSMPGSAGAGFITGTRACSCAATFIVP